MFCERISDMSRSLQVGGGIHLHHEGDEHDKDQPGNELGDVDLGAGPANDKDKGKGNKHGGRARKMTRFSDEVQVINEPADLGADTSGVSKLRDKPRSVVQLGEYGADGENGDEVNMPEVSKAASKKRIHAAKTDLNDEDKNVQVKKRGRPSKIAKVAKEDSDNEDEDIPAKKRAHSSKVAEYDTAKEPPQTKRGLPGRVARNDADDANSPARRGRGRPSKSDKPATPKSSLQKDGDVTNSSLSKRKDTANVNANAKAVILRGRPSRAAAEFAMANMSEQKASKSSRYLQASLTTSRSPSIMPILLPPGLLMRPSAGARRARWLRLRSTSSRRSME
ncbi:uncharacterized protein BCR38DRAFT_108281 [Pseudomassariella vexata]|uniref:Uncharacterized protein n=1 Tax=Pseudomassariella vexata TaxID=1141098 RepID=A0A1Y2DCZ0_9PEZI|nr:uncharacterized protein BCR38DRAFT_108281 [Pseudomassariella vexata]ORY57143.1 hypothetical protein BCR38DRAFT_108281 [Pseudomassariella vexata]